jgi:hypothetical protein
MLCVFVCVCLSVSGTVLVFVEFVMIYGGEVEGFFKAIAMNELDAQCSGFFRLVIPLQRTRMYIITVVRGRDRPIEYVNDEGDKMGDVIAWIRRHVRNGCSALPSEPPGPEPAEDPAADPKEEL